MPRRCTEIYLTLELFSGTASIMEDVLRDLEKSVAYWRAIIPHRLIAAYSAACLLLFMVICFVSGGYEQEQLSKALAVDLDARRGP